MMKPLFLLVAVLLGLGGLLNLSQATLGVGLVCLGCLSAIFARIVQADEHEKTRMEQATALGQKVDATRHTVDAA